MLKLCIKPALANLDLNDIFNSDIFVWYFCVFALACYVTKTKWIAVVKKQSVDICTELFTYGGVICFSNWGLKCLALA